MNKTAASILKAALVVSALTTLPILYGLLIVDAPPVNEAAYAALRRIEAACLAETIPTVRCRDVLEKIDDCEKGDRCPIETYYCAVSRAGFDLPDLSRTGRQPVC